MQKRLAAAMAAYLFLALCAAFTLQDPFRLVVWIFLGGLALKTWIAAKRDSQ
jgi:hypothetical protein